MIDVLERITELRKERNWSEYQLAEKSGLTQSTISSWYKKNMLPTLPSLSKLSNAFEISLSQFFMEENESKNCVTFTQRQLRLLEYSSKLSNEQFDALNNFLRRL